MEEHKINFVIGARKILSVNSLYASTTLLKYGKYVSTIYKSKEAKNAETYIKDQVNLLNIPENYPWVNQDTLFKLTVCVIFKSGILSRDLDNCLKLIQDGIFRALGINDSHVIEIQANKCFCSDLSEEKICISLEEISNINKLRFDYIPKPEIVWCEETLNKYKDFGKRKTRGVIYKTSIKEQANSYVYILDPNKMTYNTFGNIREDLDYVSREIKLAYIFVLGTEQDWGNIWKDLEEFKNIVNEYSSNYSGIKLQCINSRDEIYDLIK